MKPFLIAFDWPDYRLSPNGRPGHRIRARLTKDARRKAAKKVTAEGLGPFRKSMPVAVYFHPPSGRWDKDNCRAMAKPILDGIADALGVNDRTFDVTPHVEAPRKGGAIIVAFEIPGQTGQIAGAGSGETTPAKQGDAYGDIS